MNRKIEFRGKHIHILKENEKLNGTWVYGYLCSENYIFSEELGGDMLVDKNTIGQYTGLKDKNGNKIFEGDIMKNKQGGIGIVKYSKYAEFILDFIDDIFVSSFSPSILRSYEVIGNIYENDLESKGE